MRRALSIFGFIPSVWPVVQRELRARARKPRYYWIRVLGGMAAMLTVGALLVQDFGTSSRTSLITFVCLDLLLLALIAITVPAMTSDCVARERREGTLGLLFLTPLTPAGILIGKCVTQALLAWSIWVSILPAMIIPFLLGGVGWGQLISAVVFQLCVVIISLAAGLLASCLAQRRSLTLICSTILTGCFVSTLSLFMYAMGICSVRARSYSWDAICYSLAEIKRQGVIPSIGDGLSIAVDVQIGGAPRSLPWGLFLIGTSCVAIAIFITAIWLAAHHIRKTWGDNPPSARQQWWTKVFCTDLFRDSFRRKMRRTLDRNPIAWLQQYSWKARITKWSICLLFLIVEGYAIKDLSPNTISLTQNLLLGTLVVVGTVAGVGSFRSEKESGALELILITPLSVNKIILGRVIGWWQQFLPAAFLFLLFEFACWGSSLYTPFYNSYYEKQIAIATWTGLIIFLSLPFFSVYAALRVKHFLAAVAVTWTGLALQFAFGFSIATLFEPQFAARNQSAVIFFTFLSSIAFVRLTFFLLRHSLSRRLYSF